MTFIPEIELDNRAREEALDVRRSFIVKAPAGSGKTQLLALRLLALLAVVEEPDHILAITFTKAATAEMRARVLGWLASAQAGETMEEPEKGLARRALDHAIERGWALLEQPHRLNIQTIDSLSLSIAHGAPLFSRLGGKLQPTDDALPLYRMAARRTMERLAAGPVPVAAALKVLLRLRDVNVAECERLMADMLCNRDQWLGMFANAERHDEEGWATQRAQLEEPFQRERASVFAKVDRLLCHHPVHGTHLLALAMYACGNNPNHGMRGLMHMRSLTEVETFEHYDCLRQFLLTSEGTWRKRVTRTEGFPAAKDGGSKQQKDDFLTLLDELNEIAGLREALCAVGCLPAERFTESEWRTVRSIFTVLLHAAAELRIVFSETASIDFVEAAMTAAYALQDAEVRRRWSEKVRHLLVDEFQDTSRRQYDLLKSIVCEWDPEDGRSCFLVGDPMQSVYLFRQADMALFNEALQHGLGCDTTAVTFYPLTLRRNFRSTAGVVEPLNAIFSALSASEFVPGVADSRTSQANAVHVGAVLEQDGSEPERGEAELAVAAIRPHLAAIAAARGDGKEFRVGVLVRAKRHVALIAEALRTAGIAYRAIDIETLEERQEVRDLLSLIRALLSPVDRVAWLSVLRAPWCGLSLKDLHILCGEDDRSLLKKPVPELLSQRIGLLSEDGARRATRVFATLQLALDQRFSGVYSASPNGFAAWVERTWTSLGGPQCLDANAHNNVEAFLRMLSTLPPDGMEAGHTRMIAKIKRLFAQPAAEATEKAGVQLMTIHKAKGLGFDVVVLAGMEKRTGRPETPLLRWIVRTQGEGPGRELLLAPLGSKGDNSSTTYRWMGSLQKREERDEVQRLLYVACTRARKELHLLGTVCVKQGELKPPQERSLLGAGWAALESGFRSHLTAEPFLVPAAAAQRIDLGSGRWNAASGEMPGLAIAAGAAGQLLRRLPSDWAWAHAELSASALLEGPAQLASAPRDGSDKQDERPERAAARTFGIGVHGLLQQMASLAPGDTRRDLLQSSTVTYWRNIAAALLRNAGAHGRELADQAARSVAVLAAATADAHGRWILGARRDALDESEWTISIDSAVRRLRADRVFVAGNSPLAAGESHLWIIDYKTTLTAGGESVTQSLIASERARHQEQLARYGRVLREAAASALPFRFGLYYPAVPLLDWWEE